MSFPLTPKNLTFKIWRAGAVCAASLCLAALGPAAFAQRGGYGARGSGSASGGRAGVGARAGNAGVRGGSMGVAMRGSSAGESGSGGIVVARGSAYGVARTIFVPPPGEARAAGAGGNGVVRTIFIAGPSPSGASAAPRQNPFVGERPFAAGNRLWQPPPEEAAAQQRPLVPPVRPAPAPRPFAPMTPIAPMQSPRPFAPMTPAAPQPRFMPLPSAPAGPHAFPLPPSPEPRAIPIPPAQGQPRFMPLPPATKPPRFLLIHPAPPEPAKLPASLLRVRPQIGFGTQRAAPAGLHSSPAAPCIATITRCGIGGGSFGLGTGYGYVVPPPPFFGFGFGYGLGFGNAFGSPCFFGGLVSDCLFGSSWNGPFGWNWETPYFYNPYGTGLYYYGANDVAPLPVENPPTVTPPNENYYQVPSSATLAAAISEAEAQQPPPAADLVLNDGTTFGVTSYWLENNRLYYVTTIGIQTSIPLSELDLQKTVDLNFKRGVKFTLSPQPQTPPPPNAQPN